MNFLDWLETTRQKPEGVRRRVALLLTFLIMLVVVAVWLSLVLFAPGEKRADVGQNSPFSIFTDMFNF